MVDAPSGSSGGFRCDLDVVAEGAQAAVLFAQGAAAVLGCCDGRGDQRGLELVPLRILPERCLPVPRSSSFSTRVLTIGNPRGSARVTDCSVPRCGGSSLAPFGGRRVRFCARLRPCCPRACRRQLEAGSACKQSKRSARMGNRSECPSRLHVIASQRVGAKRRPMPGSAKQSRIAKQDWIASSQVLLAMTAGMH